jgi:hypothetical protein
MWEEGGKRFALCTHAPIGKGEKKLKNLMQKCTYCTMSFFSLKSLTGRVGGGWGGGEMECGDFGCESHGKVYLQGIRDRGIGSGRGGGDGRRVHRKWGSHKLDLLISSLFKLHESLYTLTHISFLAFTFPSSSSTF